MIEKAYRFETADALLEWSTAEVSVDDPTRRPATAWLSPDTRPAKFYLYDPERRRKFFRLRVR